MHQEHRRNTGHFHCLIHADFIYSLMIAMSGTTTTLDIVVCYDCSFSLSFHSNYLRRMMSSMFRKLVSSDQMVDIRMSLIEFQSHHDPWTIRVKPFTSSLDEFLEWIDAIETKGENFVDCKAIGKKKTKQ